MNKKTKWLAAAIGAVVIAGTSAATWHLPIRARRRTRVPRAEVRAWDKPAVMART